MYNYPITVEFEDIDSYGIIHHPKLLYYFERTRAHFFLDNNVELNSLSHGLVIRSINIQYKQQLNMFDKIVVELRAKNIDKFRFEFDYVVKKDDKVTNVATLEMVVISIDTKRIAEIPSDLRDILQKITE